MIKCVIYITSAEHFKLIMTQVLMTFKYPHFRITYEYLSLLFLLVTL